MLLISPKLFDQQTVHTCRKRGQTVYWKGFSWCNVWPLTSVTEKEAADPCKQRQSDEVSEAGSDGGGHIIWVDAHFPGSDDHCHHHQPWQSTRWRHSKKLKSAELSGLLCVLRHSFLCGSFNWPKDSAAMKAVVTLLAHRTAAWVTSTLPLVRPPRTTAATAARKPTTVAWTWGGRTGKRDVWHFRLFYFYLLHYWLFFVFAFIYYCDCTHGGSAGAVCYW